MVEYAITTVGKRRTPRPLHLLIYTSYTLTRCFSAFQLQWTSLASSLDGATHINLLLFMVISHGVKRILRFTRLTDKPDSRVLLAGDLLHIWNNSRLYHALSHAKFFQVRSRIHLSLLQINSGEAWYYLLLSRFYNLEPGPEMKFNLANES
jgi:hypothetical protein